MKVQHIKLVPTALLIVNTLNIGQAQAEDTLVCSTTGSGIDDFFCGPDSSTSGARRSIAIGDNVLIPKITVPGKTGIEQAIAIGSNVQGGGDNSITLGNDIITAGTGSVAIGGDDAAGIYNAGNKGYLLKTYGAKNNDSNISDFRANAALGNGTVSLGAGAQALADGAISIGAAATAGDGTQNGTGWSSTSGKQSIALGVESSALNHNAIALGYRANVTGYSGTAIGENASATSNNAIALGTNAMARDISDIAIGLNAIAQNSNGVTLASSLAIGSEAKAMTNNSFAIGSEAQALSPGAIAFGPSTTAGNNTGPAAGNNAIAIGFLANAPSQNSLAMGRGATTNGAPQSIALGYAAKTSAAEAIALGTNSAASGLNSIALGKEAKTTATNSIAIGTGSLVSGLNSGAIGVPGTVSGSNAYSVGNNNTIMADNAFVVGNAVNNTVENSVALGNGSTVSGATGTSVYTVNGVTHNFAGAVPVSTVSIGAAGKERTLTNVAAARISAGSTDAVNGSQLFAVTSEVDKGNQFAGNTGTFNRRLGEPTIISGGLATNATASNKNIRTIAKDGTIDIQLADNLDVTSVKVGNSVINNDGLHITDGPSVTSGGIDAGNNIIRNVADGANETDAVNKHQFDTLSGIVGKGWGLQVNSGETEAIVPGETVNFTEGDNIKITRSGKTLNIATARRVDFERATVGDITLDQATGKITGVADGELSADSKDAVSGHQLFATNQNVARNTRDIAANKALLNNGMNFAGNKGAFNRRLGEVTTISGGLATEATASNKNIRTIAKDGTIDIQLADNLDVTSVKVGNSVINNDGLHITDGPSVTSGGIDAGNNIIRNVADGANETDAVNKHQFDTLSGIVGKGWGLQVNSGETEAIVPGETVNFTEGDNIKITRSGKTLNIATARRVDFERATVGDITLDQATGKITGVADGELSADSKDAVSGHQLFATNQNVARNTRDIAANKALLNNGMNFAGNKGAFNRRLGEVTTISGGLATEATASNKNIRTIAKDGTIDIQLADNLDVTSVKAGNSVINNDGLHITDGPSVTSGGIDAGNNIIRNVADGANETDAVNKRQFDTLSGIVGKGWGLQVNSGETEAIVPGETVNFTEGDNIKITRSGKTLNIATARRVDFERATVGDITLDQATGKITGVADGELSADSKDAVSGHQLFATNQNVARNTRDIAANKALLNNGMNFAGNKGAFNRRLGEVTTISGGLATEATASNKNIRTIAKDGTIDIQLADNLDVTSVKVGNSVINNDGLHITDGPSVTSEGINAGNRVISNVGDAVSDTDAVNKRQLDNLSTTVNRGWNLQVNSGDTESIAPGDTLNITEGDNIQISRTGKTLNIATARKVSFDNVTVGNISLDKDTGKIGGLSDGLLSTNSKDAVTGGQLFSTNENVTTNTRNIAANKVLLDSGLNFTGNTGSFNRRLGETTTIRGGLAADAAASNKNIRTEAKDGLLDIQLADNLDVTSVKTGNALLSNDGLHITGGPSVTEGGIDAGNRVISNVGDAVSDTDAVNKRQLDNLSSIVGQGLTFSANEGGDITRRPGDILALRGDATTKGEYNGKNIKTVTDISTGIISIKIAESPVFGNVVINDSNSGKITGVSDGSIVSGSKDVVNGGQIHHVTTAISNIIGGNAHVSTDGSLITSNIGNTGKDTIHDAIDSVRNVAENASAGWNLSVNGQESSTVKPKDTVDLSNADGNISITKKDNQVSFNLSDSVKVKESIGIKNGPALTRSGVDGAGMKITNVADGTIAAGSSDAINGGQIHDFVNGEVTRPITFTADTGTPYDARLGTTLNVKGDKNIQTMVSGNTLSVSLNENINVKSVKATDSLSVASGASIDMGGNAIQNVGNATRPGDAVNYGQFQQAFSSLGDQINRVERRANAGAAAAIATAGLTQAYIPGKSMMSMSGGTFQGESSLAIGLSTISDNGNWVLKGSFSSTTRNQTGASVGVGFQF